MEKNSPIPRFPMPMRGMLLLAGMYTVAWGAFFKWFGDALLPWLAMDPQGTVEASSNFYGSFGLIIGFLVFLSAFYPISWMPLIVVGIAGKSLSAIWFYWEYAHILEWNKRTIFHIGFNELLWIILLAIIFLRARKVKDYLRTLPDE